MKKILCLLSLSAILLVSACSTQDQASAPTFQPPIEEIQWGMMPEEVMEVLALSEECVQSSDESVTTLLCKDMNLFGQSADVEMTFDTQAKMGLLYMEVHFADFTKELLVEALNNTYGDYSAIDKEKVPCQWESAKIEDMPEEIQERFRQVLEDFGVWDNVQDAFSMETVWDTKKAQPLVTVTLNDNILIYNAANMAGYLMFCDDSAYEELLDSLYDH